MKTKTLYPTYVAVAALILCVGATPALAATHVVNQVGFTFVPADITIAQGDTIEWHWAANNHTVTEGTPCTPSGGFNESLTAGDPIVSLTFNTVEVIDYFCVPHCGIGMTGTITVEAVSVPAVTTWGLFLIGGVILAVGAIAFRKRQAAIA